MRHHQHTDALAAGAPGAAGPVQQRLLVGRQIGMDDEAEVGQVEAARGHVRRDADARTPVPDRLQRVVALLLRQLA